VIKMDKKIYKYTVYIILLLLFSAGGYYIYQHGTDLGLEKPVLVLKVSTNLTEKGTPRVNNVTFEQSSVPFFYKTTDSVPNFPEIDVNARINNLASIPASFWASVHYTGEDTYTLKVFFRDGSEPKKGDILIMPIRIISHTGAVEYKTTAFYEWK
jgi:hypothetical protein